MMTQPLVVSTDLFVVRCSAVVHRSAKECWQKIGSFANAGRFLAVSSRLIRGDGGIGSICQVGDAVLEVVVGRSDLSYTYVQIVGPSADRLYHGCVAIEEIDEARCRVIYSISYDQTSLNSEGRRTENARLISRFKRAINAMKSSAEKTA